jgi:integrase/recombinase XerD
MKKNVKIAGLMSRAKSAKRPTSKIKHLSVGQVRRFLGVIPDENRRDRLIFHLGYYYALRRTEICLLEVGDFDLKANTVEIHRLKGGDSHAYPLFPSTKRLLLEYLDQPRRTWTKHHFPSRQRLGEPISASLVAYLFRRYAEAANLPADRRHVHVLRHSFGMHMAESGLDGLDMQDWLGHTSFNSTRVYLRVTERRRSRSLASLLESDEIA